jgi:hypothetical protein
MAQYQRDQTEISLSMLLEVIDALKGYGPDVVVVAGGRRTFFCRMDLATYVTPDRSMVTSP